MRWQDQRQSDNIEDRRGQRMRGPVMVGGGLGTLVLVLIVMFLGGNPQQLLQEIQKNQPPAQAGPDGGGEVAIDPAQEELRRMVGAVLASTEDVWKQVFRELGRQYEEPVLVLFSDQVQSACGMADAAVGPFYCPADQKVYIDLAFYHDLEQRFGAPGDFAQAYVVAHEIGHHVQKLLGISDKVDRLRQQADKVEANHLSVRLELQADFLAGVWANRARKVLEPGDIEEALRAATAIGDDRLQRAANRRVVPDSFTHGSSEQRVRWFKLGFKTGDIEQGDTFGISYDEL